MVQSNILRGTTQSGKANATWYLQRLTASADNRTRYSNNSLHTDKNFEKNSKTRVEKGNITQGQYTPTKQVNFYLNIFVKLNFLKFNQKSSFKRRSNSIYITSATSLKSTSTTNPLSEFDSNSSESLKTTTEKDILSQRRNSSTTLSSLQPDLTLRPPSTPNNQRCHRAYSSTTTSIDQETCQLLGPELCSDCIQIQARANLSSHHLPDYLIRQRLTALALRRFIKNQNKLRDDDLLKMIDNQQIQLITKRSNQVSSSIITDEEYFDQLSKSLNQYAGESSPYYFKDLNDFSQKYQSNKYQRLLLCETPAPTSSNPLFNQSSVEKLDVSSKYSYMKRASTIKPNFTSQTSTFVSPNKIHPFYLKHRSLNDYRPQFLSQNLPRNSNLQKRTLMGSKYAHQETV